MKRILILFTLLLIPLVQAQKTAGLALIPPMGWNSWNAVGCDVRESLIRQIADAIVISGMKDAGYQYVTIDDCWQGARDTQGNIQPDPTRFPAGIKALADYVHSKGLKFGIYSDAGTKTCAGRPGSKGFELQDARSYAGWGVDYLKYDWCYADGMDASTAYKLMRDALSATGRSIVFSIVEWGINKPWEWAGGLGHLWRFSRDIDRCFDCYVVYPTWKNFGVMQILDVAKDLRKYSGPDHWNDPDMLQVGNGMSINEDRAHFSMWAMLAAPLIAGNDLRRMSLETQQILTNLEVIAIDQDPLGIQGFMYSSKDGLEVWFKPLKNGDWAMAILNRGIEKQSINFRWPQNISDSLSGQKLELSANTYLLRNVWSQQVGTLTTGQALNVEVSGHDVLMLRLVKQ